MDKPQVFTRQKTTGDQLRVPLDVTEWANPDLLKHWVAEEVETLDWAHPELEQYLKEHPDFRPKELLSLLIFAYATGVLESEDIVATLRRGEQLRQFWPGPEPGAQELGRFRKENRALLKWGIVQVLKRAVQERFGLGRELRFPPGLKQVLAESAMERLDLARHMDRAAQGA